MASVIYISNKEMLENHRYNGADKINFWRPMSQSRMADFHPGDFLFFYSKEKKKGEKAVVGYGTCVKTERLSFNAMWNKYKELNGYPDKDKLKEAILDYTDKIPHKISCIYLENVVFFAGGIYLSEFGLKIPGKLESFYYLNRDGKDYTADILEKAHKIGIDSWSVSVGKSEAKEEWLRKDLRKARVSQIQNGIGRLDFSDNVKKENRRIMYVLMSENKNITKKNLDEDYYFEDKEDSYDIYFPCLIPLKNKDNIKAMVGEIEMYSQALKKEEDNARIVLVIKDSVAEYLKDKYEFPDNVKVLKFID